jgi:hypothetical protein
MRAREDLEASLVPIRQVRDTPGIVDMLNNLGRVTLESGANRGRLRRAFDPV